MLRSDRTFAERTFAAALPESIVADDICSFAVTDLAHRSCLERPLGWDPHGRSILLMTERPLPTVIALLELDSVARRLLLGTRDILPHLPSVIRDAEVDSIVSDVPLDSFGLPLIRYDNETRIQDRDLARPPVATEWVLFTSGTTGRPKMVVHSVASLTAPIDDGVPVEGGMVWSTFYDIRRYGGLQILLRALMSGGSMLLAGASETIDDFLARLSKHRVQRLSGTPSHWRKALMSGAARSIAPAYVRLSGEVADQAILDRLRATYSDASIAHAFASTEAGVAFDVCDGLAGFPASFLPHPNHPGVELGVQDGTLRIRSGRCAAGYIGLPLRGEDGFIDTGDRVERQGDRYRFVGRREGVINVGGRKVYPEEVEAVLGSHPDVQIARVWPQKSPITGAIVAADVVLHPSSSTVFEAIRADLQEACRRSLDAYKVPVVIRQVPSLPMTASGKLLRA